MLSTECFTSVVFPNTTQRSRGQYVRWPSATWKTSDTTQGPFTTHIRNSNGWLEREIHSLWVKNELGLEAAPFAPDSSNCTVRKAPAAPRSSAGNTRKAICDHRPTTGSTRPEAAALQPGSPQPPSARTFPSAVGARKTTSFLPPSPWRGSARSSRQPRANGRTDGARRRGCSARR